VSGVGIIESAPKLVGVVVKQSELARMGLRAIDNNHHVAGEDMCVGCFRLSVFEAE
jgi:hypothetical protein